MLYPAELRGHYLIKWYSFRERFYNRPERAVEFSGGIFPARLRSRGDTGSRLTCSSSGPTARVRIDVLAGIERARQSA